LLHDALVGLEQHHRADHDCDPLEDASQAQPGAVGRKHGSGP